MHAAALSRLGLRGARHHVLLPQFTARAYIEANRGLSHPLRFTGCRDNRQGCAAEKTCCTETDLSSVEVIRMGSAP